MKLVFIWGYKGYKYPFCWFQIPFLLVSDTLFVGFKYPFCWFRYPFCWFQIPFLLVSNTLFVGLDTLFVGLDTLFVGLDTLFVGSDTLFVDDIYILYIIFTKIHFIDRKELYIIFFKYPFCWFIYSIIFSNTLFVGLKYPCIDKEGIY